MVYSLLSLLVEPVGVDSHTGPDSAEEGAAPVGSLEPDVGGGTAVICSIILARGVTDRRINHEDWRPSVNRRKHRSHRSTSTY